MKRTVLLAALFVILGASAVYVLFLKDNSNASRVSWDMDFSVPDTDKIYRIFLADKSGRTVTLDRKSDHWLYNEKHRARPTAVETLLSTIAQQTVWYIPTNASEPTLIKSLASDGIKVELYDKNGKKFKVFFVGGVTNDERGTFMIMENAEQPYVVHVPSFIGQLRVRYMLDEIDWRDRTVYHEKPEAIEEITVEYPQQKSESFKLTKTGEAEYTVVPFYSTTTPINRPQRKGVAEAYLLQFEKLGAEGLETNHPQRDSISQLVPFAIVNVKKNDGENKEVRFWPVAIETRPDNNEQYVMRYFAEVDKRDFFLVQDNVFGPIFRGYPYFFGTAEIR
jgi:hypothetical protein